MGVYTLSIRGMSFSQHIRWCVSHGLVIVGFTLPLTSVIMWIDGSYYWASWMVTLVGLGFSHSASAMLLEPLVLEDCPAAAGDSNCTSDSKDVKVKVY